MERRQFLRRTAALSLIGMGTVPAFERALAEPRRRVPGGPIRLDSNENPLGISPNARQAILESIAEANRYPDVVRDQVPEALARLHGLPRACFLTGCGSTEILRVAVEAFATPGGSLVAADPTFEDVYAYSEPFGLTLFRVPLRSDYAHDLDRMREIARRAPRPVMVFVCNPNNPTGTLTPCDAVEAWIREIEDGVHLVVDEAYFHFAEDPAYRTMIPLVVSAPRLLVVRTFSKVYGLAGLRLGYGVGHPDTIARLRRHATRNNVNQAAGAAALASLADTDFVRRSLEVNRRGRGMLYRCLGELGLEALPSHTNFVMHRITGDLDEYRARMRERGILVGRPFPPMLQYSRVSIGLPEEMERFTDTLRALRAERMI